MIKAGEYQQSKKIDCKEYVCNHRGVQVINVQKIIVHPEYEPKPKWYNDIAILKLIHEVVETGNFDVILYFDYN